MFTAQVIMGWMILIMLHVYFYLRPDLFLSLMIAFAEDPQDVEGMTTDRVAASHRMMLILQSLGMGVTCVAINVL